MNTEQAYIEGFVKRAAQYGFNGNEARLLLKKAIAPTGNQLQNIYAKASEGPTQPITPSSSSTAVVGGIDNVPGPRVRRQAKNMAPAIAPAAQPVAPVAQPIAPRPAPVTQPKTNQSVFSPTGAAYSGVQLPDVSTQRFGSLPPALSQPILNSGGMTIGSGNFGVRGAVPGNRPTDRPTAVSIAAGAQRNSGNEYTPTNANIITPPSKAINTPTVSIPPGGVRPTVGASIPYNGGAQPQAPAAAPQPQTPAPRPTPVTQAQPQPQSPAPQPQAQAQAQVEQPLPRPTPLEQTPSTGGLGATQPQRPGQTQRETFVKPTRENPYYSQGARAERAGQYAQHLQSLGKAPVNNDASLPSVPRPAPILPENATSAQLTQSRDTQNANDYVSNLRQARQMADISQNNPAMAAQMQQRISRMDPMVQQAYGKMIPGSMPAAATNNATAGHMDTVDKLRAQGLI